MEPQRTCKLFGVIRAVLGIKGALPLIHGPIGCFYHIKYLLSLRSSQSIHILSTEMDQNDVVFGAEKKLAQKIKMADKKYSPQLLVVLTSCASSIIGEDIERVINNVKKDINADIIGINAGGFEGTQIEGYEECLLALIGYMDYKNVKTSSINLVGQYRGGPDLINLKNYFYKLGIDLNSVLTSGSSFKQIKNAPNAALNVSMCDASGIVPCKTMETKFNIPYVDPILPIGVRSTSNFLKMICDELNLKYTFKQEENETNKLISKYSANIKGKKALIVAGATRAIAITDFLSELGLEPVLIALDFEGINTDQKLLDLIEFHGISPFILKQCESSDILKKSVKLQPEIVIGGMGEISLSKMLKIPLLDIMHAQKITMGFNGAIEITKSLNEVLDN